MQQIMLYIAVCALSVSDRHRAGDAVTAVTPHSLADPQPPLSARGDAAHAREAGP